MASTNKTTNYELSQFVETDRPAWLTDYNGDMRTIDSAMKAISDVASGASGSISELADRMSTAEGNITTNANDIDALEARTDSLEAQSQSTAGTIANIQTEQTAQNLGIEAATELGYNLARPYDSASTYAVGSYVLFQNTLYKCITAIATGEAFDPTKWLAIKATDEINNPVNIVKYEDAISLSNATGASSASVTGAGSPLYKMGNVNILSVLFSLDNLSMAANGVLKIPVTWNTTAPEITNSIKAINYSINHTAASFSRATTETLAVYPSRRPELRRENGNDIIYLWFNTGAYSDTIHRTVNIEFIF